MPQGRCPTASGGAARFVAGLKMNALPNEPVVTMIEAPSGAMAMPIGRGFGVLPGSPS